MATPCEQVKPLAPATYQSCSDEDHEAKSKQLKLKQSRCLLCCGCLTVLVLVPVVTLIVILTAFHISDPRVKMNSIKFPNLFGQLVNGTSLNSSGENITLLADVSVKNPNVASFKFGNSTATICYGGKVVGECKIPAGVAKAKRTLRMNVSVDIIPKEISAVPSFMRDIKGELTITSYATIQGRVKILNIIKKSPVVKMNCTISYNFSNQTVRDKCVGHD